MQSVIIKQQFKRTTYLRAASRHCSATSSKMQIAILLSSAVLSLPYTCYNIQELQLGSATFLLTKKGMILSMCNKESTGQKYSE